MSRHKLVKNLDLDDELDDYDGGEDYDNGGTDAEELTEEDKRQYLYITPPYIKLIKGLENMRLGTLEVWARLPDGSAHITEKQIHEALWHYYYDMDKTVGYLITTYIAKPKKEQKKAAVGKKATGGSLISLAFTEMGTVDLENHQRLDWAGDNIHSKGCSKLFSFADFFKDSPWLNIPPERQALLIPPLYPRGGLLGGSSDGAPKMSKLQTLAAARKKKAQEQKLSDSSEVEKPMASLSINEKEDGVSSKIIAPKQPRGFPLRKRKDSNPHEKAPPPLEKQLEPTDIDQSKDLQPAQKAEPSAFANTMFSTPSRLAPASDVFSLPYISKAAPTVTDPFAGPSPDDVVIAAQSKVSGKGGKGPPKTSGEKKADQIANGVEALKFDDTPRATSKNLDVLKEFEKLKKKKEANFVVIGHVDAGKSTLMGRLLYDIKVVDQRTIDRYRKDAEKLGKASFALAWVMDQGTEERSRGITIDIAMNKFSTSETSFTILDAPGHQDFIPNMIAGASQADFAVLVIDASIGSFESGLRGQTKEHALLVRSMGVQRIVTAINKLDTVSWSQDRFDEISQQVSAFLTSAGFLPRNITFVPCSGLHGDNIVRKSSKRELNSWYNGPSLLEELENSEPITRALTKPLRIMIGDIFRGGVQNPLSISGRIEAGSLQAGDALLAQPAGEKCFVKALETDGEPAGWAVAGQNITLHLTDIDPIHLKIGDVLCSPANPIKNVKEFTAKVLAFEFLTPMQIDVHRGRLHAPGKIRDIVNILDKGSGALVGKKKPRIVKPAQLARMVVELETAVPLEAPGRIVLRSGGETVAAGLLE